MTNPSVAIVGAGRLGGTLAVELHDKGLRVREIVVRSRESLRAAGKLAHSVGATATLIGAKKVSADIVWFCVPDAQIESAASALISCAWKGRIALHSSGVLSSDVLCLLKKRGASIASAHPLMTFVPGSAPDLKGVPFAIEGDRTAIRAATAIVRKLGARPVNIRKNHKAAYHLFATMICPLLVSLLAASEEAAALAGISETEARRRMMPIIHQTLANYDKLGAPAAFTGPFVRGDVESIRLHLNAFSGSPAVRNAYVALAEAALEYLPHQNEREIRDALRHAPMIRKRVEQGKK